MNPDGENNKQVHAGNVSISEQKVSKTVNPISITIVFLSSGVGAVLVYFNITHWSIAAIGGLAALAEKSGNTGPPAVGSLLPRRCRVWIPPNY